MRASGDAMAQSKAVLRPRSLALLALACCVMASAERHLMPDGASIQLVRYRGAQPWQLFPNLFIDTSVNVTCPDKKVCGSLACSCRGCFACVCNCVKLQTAMKRPPN